MCKKNKKSFALLLVKHKSYELNTKQMREIILVIVFSIHKSYKYIHQQKAKIAFKKLSVIKVYLTNNKSLIQSNSRINDGV